MIRVPTRHQPRSGSSPAASPCTARTCSTRWPTSRGRSRSGSARAARSPVEVVGSPSLTNADDDPHGCCCEANARRRLHRRDRLDAHVLARRRCGSAGSTRCTSRCCTCTPSPSVELPWAEHRHGLHEPQPGRARRPRVRLHPVPAAASPQDGRRPRQRPAASRADRRLGARGARPRRAANAARSRGSATTCATSPSPRATRSRREPRFGVSVNTYGVNDLVAVVDAGRRRGRRRRWSREYERHLRRRPRAAAGRRPARIAARTARASSWACGSSCRTADSTRSPRTSRTSAGCGSCPGSPCSA